MNESEPARTAQPLVLVAFGDKVERLLASEVLGRAGFAVALAASGREALDKARTAKPDLILLDVALPDGEGLDFSQAYRNDEATRDMPVVVVVDANDGAAVDTALEAGAKDFVARPINWVLLTRRLRFTLRDSGVASDLRRAVARSEAANRAKSHFIANMSHELRTPLNAIIGFAEVLGIKTDDEFGAKDREYVGHIRQSGEHLLSLINDILDLSKIDAERLELRETVVDPNTVIADCLDLVTPQARRGELALESDLPTRLPGLYVDAKRLRQVLLNLLSNAVKFTPKGGHVRISAGLDPNGGFAVRIADSGIGMSNEEIELAQQPFRQVENKYTRQHDGTGLGLPLASALARAHGGKIILESAPNVGTTATLTLPANRIVRPSEGASPASPAP